MEIKPSTIENWKCISLGTLLGLFFIFFLKTDTVNQVQDVYMIATKNSNKKPMKDLAPSKVLSPPNDPKISLPSNVMLKNTTVATKEVENSQKKCNIFEGRWVYKPEEYITYNSSNCPFILDKMNCQSNGRPDSKYENWRWEARDCEIPVFNGTYMLEKMKNKRMVLVGDSLNHNMWQSLVCLLLTSNPSSTPQVEKLKGYTWKSKEYNFTLQFYWSSFLTEVNGKHESGKKVLVLDKISTKSNEWIGSGADIMVFNSGHWWRFQGKPKAWELFEFEGKIIEKMSMELAYELALKTWATWIKRNIDPNKTSVFFRSYSPVHKVQKYVDQWCYDKIQPMTDDSYVPDFPQSMFDVVETMLKGISNHVKYLNITKLSEYRVDAHPSLYTTKYDHNPNNYADCSHWCVPGVPDTWNRLLYASIFFDKLEHNI